MEMFDVLKSSSNIFWLVWCCIHSVKQTLLRKPYDADVRYASSQVSLSLSVLIKTPDHISNGILGIGMNHKLVYSSGYLSIT